MKIIKLPSVLSEDVDLVSINWQLRSREAQLDWSDVNEFSVESLGALLNGLDLSNDADILGIENDISEKVANAISKHFEEQEKKTKRSQKPKNTQQVLPKLWSGSKKETSDTEQNLTEESESLPIDSSILEISNELPHDILNKSLLNLPPTYNLRAELTQKILDDLLGPAGGPEEEINEPRVSERYFLGMLAPQQRHQTRETVDDDELAIAGKEESQDGKLDLGAPVVQTMFPSSLGMTFCLSGKATGFRITASWGQYDRIQKKPKTDHERVRTVWQRKPIKNSTNIKKLEEGQIDKWVVDPLFPSVYVQGLMRKQDGEWIITLFLVNAQQEPERLRDKAWLFQPELSVDSIDSENQDIFLRRPRLRDLIKGDPIYHAEEQSMCMIYRKEVEFAVGHGVGIHAEKSKLNPERAVRISTAVVPSYEVPKTTPPKPDEIEGLTDLVLDMKELSEMPNQEIFEKLTPITSAYQTWINTQLKKLNNPDELLDDFDEVAKAALENCSKALSRINEGLKILHANPTACEAFRFMNRSMWLQRIHTIISENKRRNIEISESEIDIPKNRTWYPFQIAFVLLNLPSLTDLNHPDRNETAGAIADLLWFPTGGGKTEAYLGLTAYTLGIRRLQGTIEGRSGDFGVAVLMRYTLRLLTLQQFQRATALICACESIRKDALNNGISKWGSEPFRIGLWVGQKTTPNKTDQSEEVIKNLRGQYSGSVVGSPHQLTNCPWCGHKIDQGQNIKVDSFNKGTGRTVIYCGDPLGRCLFTQAKAAGEGLPVLVVDEEIYRRLPSLLIATVDKFAQMPWKGEVEMLFGQVNGYCERHGFRSPETQDSDSHPGKYGLPSAKTLPHGPLRPPDLVIQDELHLISGPLGTLVGLYETAIDKLSSWEVNGKTVRPKVIASTATIRQAADQIRKLFLRQVNIFPPQGLDVGDNFFSKQRNPDEENPGRLYLGICAPGRRLKAALIRVYIAQLAAAQSLFEKYGKHADPWMTLVGYFNSLRELGGMRRLVDDDVKARLGKMDKRGLAARRGITIEELTSRKGSSDIPFVLDRLEVKFDPLVIAEIKARRRSGQKVVAFEPLDVLLATNMISVGVDVKRLGVMVVAGQPKTTSEYIQATSRVGRHFPGLVLTVYNWARPRDLSHYESFEHYHGTFYQHVEALSVTPFSSGALDRGLAALLVSLIRLSGQEFNENLRAGTIERNHPYVKAAIDTIVNRAWEIDGGKTRDYVRQEIAQKLDIWLDQAKDRTGGKKLGYKSGRDGLTVGLLKDPYTSRWEDFSCLLSLRNVEPTVGLILYDAVPDDDHNRQPQSMNVETSENESEVI